MIFEALHKLYKQEQILINECMSRHTSFKIGGPAKAVLLPESVEQISQTIEICKQMNERLLIMGNGSNILVEDQGIDAIIVKISDQMSKVIIEGTNVIAEAGVLLSSLSKKIQNAKLSGCEFASGIPGTLGGAIYMNAGAYGGEMKDVVKWVEVITPENEILRLSLEEMHFSYRNSVVREKGYIVLRCALELTYGDPIIIQEITSELTQKRVTKQPLEFPSAGSIFKRPVGHYAGKLIEDAGLRGLRHGDAQVSEKHCGFVINRGNATFNEVMDLIKVVQKVVKDTFDIELEREVRIFGKE